MLLNRIFENQNNGYYVDIGAHHPSRFSNTCFFYKKGWKGINVDCNPGSMKAFRNSRKRDLNFEYAISDTLEEVKYFRFAEPALNSCVEGNTKETVPIKTMKINTVTLEHILDKNLAPGLAIDFLTVDVEGMDLRVLNSNNWRKYRPKIVLVEDILYNLEYTADSKIIRYMNSVDYVLFAKTVNTFIFREKYFNPFVKNIKYN